MFNVNLLNRPGEQRKNAKDNFISSNGSSGNNIDSSKSNKQNFSDTSLKSPLEDKKKIDLFAIIIIFLIIGIIVSVFLGYYFEKL